MSEQVQKPKILVARAIFPDILTRLEQLADVQSNQEDHLWNAEDLKAAMANKDAAIVTGGERVDADILKASPQLKIVSNIAVGYNNFDMAAFSAANVMATNTPDVLTDTTADFGFALLMATARRVTESEHWLRAGNWKKFSIYDTPLSMDIHHSTLGIMGMGRIGQAIARRARGFNMNVKYYNRSRLSADLEKECGATYVDRDTLLKESDHIILVMPYTPENHHLFGEKELNMMKPTATLVNIARGGIVDELALAKALQANKIFAAGIDVFEGEPTVRPELLALKNVVLAPHIASATEKTRRAMIELAIENCLAGLAGKTPPNLLKA
ncbi:2-hydroxyacid dehydrogenase [Polynucleobacter victoriensis]|uniref:Gluconate 2-dehydrogenase n=1 Tax=Polynucleobacter victoriensis TaxID=2049319 RepID=A0A212T4A5_9BURK|nr:D-glycerate dehydrogenase [Polynucleobacter victoriensis]SNC60882.1 gluconate 2-dehydrogenase [Polynucleobacter victoriensis]